MRRLLAFSAVLASAAGAAVYAQSPRGGSAAPAQPATQVVTPPEARYWMGATTNSGMLAMSGMAQGGRPSMKDMLRMSAGGPPSEGHSVELRLGTSLLPQGEPEATHTMPPGAQVNRPIALITPESGPGTSGPAPAYTQPKGQISFYWGCGEKAGPGQPVVLTFDKLMRGEDDSALQALDASVSAREVRKPMSSNSKTYGDWPHADSKNKNRGLTANFPVGSTLAGPHVVDGSYTPRIEFALAQNFLDAVRYTSTGVQPSGSILVNWSAVDRATGYSLGVMAPSRAGDDSASVVMWSSADRPATFLLMQDLTPAEVKRLIGLKAVLPPQTTSCAVPAEVVKATKEGSMLMFTAFGDEATFVHPPRPADPKVTWDQEWFARVSYKSVRMDMISPSGIQDMTMMSGRPAPSPAPSAAAGSPAATQSDEEYCKQLEEERRARPSAAGAIGGAVAGRFGRLMGKKKDQPPADPRCVGK